MQNRCWWRVRVRRTRHCCRPSRCASLRILLTGPRCSDGGTLLTLDLAVVGTRPFRMADALHGRWLGTMAWVVNSGRWPVWAVPLRAAQAVAGGGEPLEGADLSAPGAPTQL